MKNIKSIFICFTLLMFSCDNNTIDQNIINAVMTYIDETELSDKSHIEVYESYRDHLVIYQIFEELIYDENKMPSKIDKVKDVYVLYYFMNSSAVSANEIPKDIKQTKEYYETQNVFLLFHPDEWLLVTCKDSRIFKLLKHNAFKPFDEVQRIKEMVCK